MPVGSRTTYNQSAAGTKLLVDDLVEILSNADTPVSNLFGMQGVDNTRYEWRNDELMSWTVTAAANSNSGSATINVGTGDSGANSIRVGDVLQLRGGTVQALVTAVNLGTGDLTVTRPYAGSTDQNIVTSDVLLVVAQAPTEGGDPGNMRSVDTTALYNFTQIFQEGIQASRTARKQDQYVIQDPYNYELEKKAREMGVLLERTILYGRRNNDTANSRRTMGGLFSFIVGTGVGVTTTKASVTDGLDQLLQGVWDKGADETLTLACPPNFLRVFSQLDKDRVIVDRNETEVGQVKMAYRSPFGVVKLVPARQMARDTRVLALMPRFVTKKVLTAWTHEPLAKTGDSDKGQLIGEYGLQVKHPEAMGVLTVSDLNS